MLRSLSASALATALLGCSVYDPSLVAGTDGGAIDGGSGGPSRRPPPRPGIPDDGSDVGEVTFALRDVVLDQSADLWRTIGLDLDGLFTRTVEDPVECIPPLAGAMTEVDGEEGIDNAFGHRLYPVVELVLTTLEEDARAAQAAGRGALLVRVHGWNGQAEDPQIDAVVSQTSFGTPCDSDGSPPAGVRIEGFDLVKMDGSPADPPAWEGNDCWWARADTFVPSGGTPRIRDDRAYVTGRTAVIRIPDRSEVLFFAGAQSVVVRLTDAAAVARISEDGRRLEDVLVAGRWALVDLMETAPLVGVCDGTTEMRILNTQLMTIADIRSAPGTGGPGVECDAISVGVTFAGVRGRWVDIADAPPPPSACPPP